VADTIVEERPVVDRSHHRAGLQRTYRHRRLAVFGVIVLCAAALLAPAYAVWNSDLLSAKGDDTASPTTVARPTRSTTSTTSTVPATTAPTTAPPTTVPAANAAPAVATPGITVGPLTEGPGPIPVVHRIPTFDKVVFITIDDGVTADPLALQIIRDQHVPVTMFLTQRYMPTNQDYFKQLIASGAVLASHSITHQSLRGKDEPTQRREICGPSADYAQRFGITPDLFRPPYGNWDPLTVQIAASCGMRAVVHWSATYDAGTLATTGGPLRAGDIILLHFKPGLGLNLTALLAQIQAAGLHPAQLADYIRSAPKAGAPPAAVAPAPGPAVPTLPGPTPTLPEGTGGVTG
jgi:peptidoglycan/xylan/chitin deacetylase (PgdA/CDA1 family)